MSEPVSPTSPVNPANTVILSSTLNGVRTLTLNRPDKLNAANDDLLLGLTAALKQAETDDTVRVVVITAQGRGFCVGQDLSSLPEGRVDFTAHLHRTYNPLIRTMTNLEKPVISAVNGIAAGAGASLALAGDIRLWAQSAAFIEVFSNIALVPDSGSTWLLPRVVGYQRAFEMMAFAEKITSDNALKLGLCEHIYPDESFHTDVQTYAEKLAARPAHALKLIKQALQAALSSTLDEALDQEAVLQQLAGDHWEHQEGVTAFKEKRPANFKRENT